MYSRGMSRTSEVLAELWKVSSLLGTDGHLSSGISETRAHDT